MYDIEKLKTNLDMESEGVWHDFGHGARVKVARTNNPAFNSFVRKNYKANRAALQQDDDVSAELSEAMMINAYAHTILKDFEGFALNSEPLPFSVANAKTLLEIRDFRDRIKDLAESADNFRAQAEEAAVGN